MSYYFNLNLLLRYELYCSIVLFELIADCLKCCRSEFCSCISRSQIVGEFLAFILFVLIWHLVSQLIVITETERVTHLNSKLTCNSILLNSMFAQTEIIDFRYSKLVFVKLLIR